MTQTQFYFMQNNLLEHDTTEPTSLYQLNGNSFKNKTQKWNCSALFGTCGELKSFNFKNICCVHVGNATENLPY